LDGPCGLLIGVLNFRAEGKDRTCAYVEWNTVQRGIRIDLMTSLLRCARPEVIPRWRIRQIQSPAGSVRLKHRTDEDRRPKHELIANVARVGISPPVHH